MLSFITKSQYWSLLDQDIEKKLRKNVFQWHLKSIQDAVALYYLNSPSGKRIAEIGGGNSRILPAISSSNECTNIEKFGGQHGGPLKEIKFRKVRNVRCFVGEFSSELETSYWDILFSVSVVEHISNPDLANFIADCHRILRPNGVMIHLVDMYLNSERRHVNGSRIKIYNSAFDRGDFEPLGAVELTSEDDLGFKESYCTNPDNAMYAWNKINASLRDLRETSQSVSLIWAGKARK